MKRIIPNGNATYTADGAIAYGQLVKLANGKVKACDAATDVAIGIALDSAADGELIPIAIAGIYPNVVEMKAGGAINAGAEITPEGKEQTNAGTTELICGRALEAATTEGDMILVALCVAHGK